VSDDKIYASGIARSTCCNVPLLYVHSHYQCSRCHRVEVGCCDGAPTDASAGTAPTHEDCLGECDARMFKPPICSTCKVCRDCAAASEYTQNLPGAPPPKNKACPECRL